MTKQEKILEWAEDYLESVAHNGYYNGLGLRMLEDLSEQGCVLKVERELPHCYKHPDTINLDCFTCGIIVGRSHGEAVEPLIPTPTTKG